jgi:hypothetical protein
VTHEEFEAILGAQAVRIRDVLINKTAEYATDDQLYNIRQVAALRKCSMAEAVAGMMAKHTVSIYAMIDGPDTFSEETWDEKITDHIIWLILLKAALIDEAQTVER